MKKLSLKNLKLDGEDILQRDQLKSIFGGSGGALLECANGKEFNVAECSSFIINAYCQRNGGLGICTGPAS